VNVFASFRIQPYNFESTGQASTGGSEFRFCLSLRQFDYHRITDERKRVIWRAVRRIVSIGAYGKNLRAGETISALLSLIRSRGVCMRIECEVLESYEISPRFRTTIEERIKRLEEDAKRDEAIIESLQHVDHIRRQLRLVAAERAEALRMRLFLDRARTRKG
jgi:hypothetical protein